MFLTTKYTKYTKRFLRRLAPLLSGNPFDLGSWVMTEID